jgi:nucleoside-diphosphate-sugar epimerase
MTNARLLVIIFLYTSLLTDVAGLSLSRRAWLETSTSFSLISSTSFPNIAVAESLPADVLAAPVLVLGASGRTGRECVKYLLSTNRPCIATTRTGEYEYDFTTENASSQRNLLTIATADVTKRDSLQSVIAQQSPLAGVIYAASASRKGGSPALVDRDGVIAAAQACIAARVPRYVVISSGAVTRPDSLIYKLLNSFGNIMEAKIQGEDEVRRLYADPTVLERRLGYTIVRPGGLSMEAAVGPSQLELNQGDMISGRLPRAGTNAPDLVPIL